VPEDRNAACLGQLSFPFDLQLESAWSYIDLDRNERVKFTRIHQLDVSATPISRLVSGPTESNSLLTAISPGGNFTAHLRKAPPGKKSGDATAPPAVEFIDVWDNAQGRKLSTINLKVADKHGKVHTDGASSKGDNFLIFLAMTFDFRSFWNI